MSDKITFDTFHDGRPTRIAHAHRDVRQPQGSLPVSEGNEVV